MSRVLSLVIFAPVLLSACAIDARVPPPPLPPPPIEIAPPAPPAAPAAGPTLLVVPRAEATPTRAPKPPKPKLVPMESEGRRHALERTEEGILAMSEERGVLGFLPRVVAGAEIRWAGFVEDDAVLVATRDAVHRAATIDDAIAGKLEKLDAIDPAATMIASAGKVVVAVVPEAGGAYYESRDGGRRFTRATPPTEGSILELAVRSDGAIVAAGDPEKVEDARGNRAVRATIQVSRRPGVWTRGPRAESTYGWMIEQSGDTLWVNALSGVKGELAMRALDQRGSWIAFELPEGWLGWTGMSPVIEPRVPRRRPGFPRPAAKAGGGGGVLGGLLGGLGMGGLGVGCRGVACLARRSLIAGAPLGSAFDDSVCRAEDVRERSESYTFHDGRSATPKTDTWVIRECDPAAAPRRAATLLLRGEAPTVARLPPTCASGRVHATDRAVFVQCSDQHRGRPALLHLAPSGAFTEIVAGPPGDAPIHGAMSASDGTTFLLGDKRALLCRAGERASCVAVPREKLLAARPLPGGRALIARRGDDEHELVLELFGEPGSTPVRSLVVGNLLDLTLTADGHVRLWTSTSLGWMPDEKDAARRRDERKLFAYRVGADGALYLDLAAQEALGPAQ